MKRTLLAGFVLSVLLLTCVMAGAQPADPWNTIYETPIGKTATRIKEMLLPFSARGGFPDTRPVGMEKASYEELYKAAAARSFEGMKIFAEMINKSAFTKRLELGARYFMKRLEIGAQLYPEKAGNERVFEFLCHDFAAACDNGLEELRYWAVPEGLVFDNIWYKIVHESFIPVKEQILKAVVPENVVPANARMVWKQAAAALIAFGNEAGIASTKVGSMGLAAFPAWRLKYAMKYFKAASKAAVVDKWHSRHRSYDFWVKACEQLRQDIATINAEMEDFLGQLH